ncbi:hypothetical protein GGI35DRAFT_465452 [Trichoderma velutinum]
MPGERYCRHRDTLGSLCWKDDKLSSESAIRKHYRDAHEMEVEHRAMGANPSRLQQELDRWYTQIVQGLRPTWIPRKAADPSVELSSELEDDDDEDDDRR